MKKTKIIMGMPITVEVVGGSNPNVLKKVFDYFISVDARYSTYKSNSEISKINRGLPKSRWSREMIEVLKLCEQTKKQTGGYFNIERTGKLDPSGLVKGWAINNAAKLLSNMGHQNFYIEAGGDIQAEGFNDDSSPWVTGIRNPFNIKEIIKVVEISGQGIATSGTYIRREHIYNPLSSKSPSNEVASLTVIGPNIYEADRFATAAFAMGSKGINFIEGLPGFEAYSVGQDKIATLTSGFEKYVAADS